MFPSSKFILIFVLSNSLFLINLFVLISISPLIFLFKKILEEIIPFIRTLFLKKFSTFIAFTFNTNLKLKGERSIFLNI